MRPAGAFLVASVDSLQAYLGHKNIQHTVRSLMLKALEQRTKQSPDEWAAFVAANKAT
jgi:hypothetical protein